MFERIGARQPDIFGVMDLTSGYHQAPLTTSAKILTAFICFSGNYQFTRLPFGLKRAPSYFQEMMATDRLHDQLCHFFPMVTFKQTLFVRDVIVVSYFVQIISQLSSEMHTQRQIPLCIDFSQTNFGIQNSCVVVELP